MSRSATPTAGSQATATAVESELANRVAEEVAKPSREGLANLLVALLAFILDRVVTPVLSRRRGRVDTPSVVPQPAVNPTAGASADASPTHPAPVSVPATIQPSAGPRRSGFLIIIASLVLVAGGIVFAWYWRHRSGSQPTPIVAQQLPKSAETALPGSKVDTAQSAGAPALPMPAVDPAVMRRQAADVLAGMIQRGAWIVGTVTDDTGRESHAILFEVTESSTTRHQISLVLRNDRGIWTHTRTFSGDWQISADGDSCTLNLYSRGLNGDRNGGPVLDNDNTLYLTLQLWTDGSITASPRTWQLHAVPAADVAATKAQFGFSEPKPRLPMPPPADATAPSREPAPANASIPPQSNPGDATPPSRDSATGSAGVPPASNPANATPPSRSSDAAPSLNLQLSTFTPHSAPGAYVLSAGRWQLLPHNHGHLVQTADQANALLDRIAGNATPADEKPAPVGSLSFDVDQLTPKASGADLTLAYIGPRSQPTPEQFEKFPALRSQPALELAPLKIGKNNVRSCPLYFVGGGVLGFGPNRIAATVETPSENIALMHVTVPLAPGRYAVSTGAESYELVVQ